jgi:hypothetical protein
MRSLSASTRISDTQTGKRLRTSLDQRFSSLLVFRQCLLVLAHEIMSQGTDIVGQVDIFR